MSICVLIHCISAFLAHMSALITFLLWTPNPDHIIVYYILAALWGVGDAVIQTQVNGNVACVLLCRIRRPLHFSYIIGTNSYSRTMGDLKGYEMHLA